MILLYFLIATLPLANHPLWNEYAGEMTVVKYVGGACLAYALLYLSQHGHASEYFRATPTRLFALFFLLMSISYLITGPSFTIQDNKFLAYSSFALLFFVVAVLVDSPERLRWALLTAIGSVAFASLYVLRDWQKGSVKPGWVVGDVNYFGASAALTLPVAFYLLSNARARWERVFCGASLALTLVAATIGGSRGGFLGLVTGLLLVVWRSRHRLRNLALAMSLVLSLSLSLSVSPIERLLRPSESDQGSADSRVASWQAGWRMILANPIFGVGLSNFQLQVGRYGTPKEMPAYVAHNMYLEIAAELGIPSLLAFVAMLGSAFRDLGAIRRRTGTRGPVLLAQAALGMQAGLVGFAVAGFFVSAQYLKLFWLMLSLAACLGPLARSATRPKMHGRVRSSRHSTTPSTLRADG